MNKSKLITKFLFISSLIILFIASYLIWSKFILVKKQDNSHISTTTEMADSNISTIVVPHHDLVKEKRSAFLKEIALNNQPETIILVSLNHFLAGSYDITTTKQTWELQDKELFADQEKIDQLINNNVISSEESAFSREHGIRNLLGEIKDYFPQSKIIPIIFKENADSEKINQLAQNLDKICLKKCLLISSVDFSHYQPGALSEIHDNLSIRVLTNLDEEAISRAEVDSRESLLLAIKWAKLQETEQFILKENTNSGKINNERDSETTSYVFGYWQKVEQKNMSDEFTFMVGGDMMFARFIDHTFSGDNLKNAVANLGDRLFSGTDLSLINLEGPISSTLTNPSTDPNNIVFNFPPKTTDVLQWLNINTVSLANNHSGNAGKDGLTYTKKILTDKGINYIGQQSIFNNESIRRYQAGNTKISVIAINLLETEDTLTQTIKQEKDNGNFILIFPHWGNEYQATHSSSQQAAAHRWIDSGADLIIGSHPHVIEDAEIYKGKPIFYSLGNLLFDQTFSRETQRGLIIAGEITANKLKLVLLPTISKNLRPELLTGSEKTSLISKFRDNLNLEISNKDYGYDTIEITK